MNETLGYSGVMLEIRIKFCKEMRRAQEYQSEIKTGNLVLQDFSVSWDCLPAMNYKSLHV